MKQYKVVILFFYFTLLNNFSFATECGVKTDCQKRAQRLFILDVLEGHEEKVRGWIEEGIDVNQEINGITALLVAVGQGQEKIVELLVEKNADVNFFYDDQFTVLHLAAIGTSENIIKILLGAGAEVNVETEAGETPYDLAEREGKKNFLRLLKRKARTKFLFWNI